MNIIEFEETLVEMRMAKYRHPDIDIISQGFRPVSGKVADFGVAELDGVWHFFYIERRLAEGTPFYPGNEIYFGHASTRNLADWEVHDPVMLIRPGTWEGAHVWARGVLRLWGGAVLWGRYLKPRPTTAGGPSTAGGPNAVCGCTYVMAYTGVNEHISQDIGLAFSDDLFEWRRWEGNPISPCKGRQWANWREDRISSCRDPHLFEHEGRFWMTYTANTAAGATCIAMCSSVDLEQWDDHGPILVGSAQGYEPRLEGGHPQGSLESANLQHRSDRWHLLVNASVRGADVRNWIFTSDRMDSFDFAAGREFWRDAGGIEVLGDCGSESLLAAFCNGFIRFGVVDWSADEPVGRFVQSREELDHWSARVKPPRSK